MMKKYEHKALVTMAARGSHFLIPFYKAVSVYLGNGSFCKQYLQQLKALSGIICFLHTPQLLPRDSECHVHNSILALSNTCIELLH